MECALSEMIMDCDQSNPLSSVIDDGYDHSLYYGENTICLGKDMRIVGTKRGSLVSDSDIFVVEEDIQLSLVDLRLESYSGEVNWNLGDNACIANYGALEMLRVSLHSQSREASTVVTSGNIDMEYCDLENIMGSCMYFFEDINLARTPLNSFEENTFNYLELVFSVGDGCFEFDKEGYKGMKGELKEQLKNNNTIIKKSGVLQCQCSCCGGM